MLQRLQRKPSRLTGFLMCVVPMTTIWPVSQEFSPVSVYSPAHTCTRLCFTKHGHASSGLDQIYRLGWSQSSSLGAPVPTGSLTSSAPAMFLGPSSWPGWGHWFRVPREEPRMKVSFPFFIFPAFSVVNEMLLLDQQGSGSGGWFLCGGMWNLWKTRRTSDVELSHEDRSRFMVGLAGIPVWTGSLNWYQNHLCSASKDQVCFKTCPGLVSRCLSDPEGAPLGGLNSGASLSFTSSPEVLVLTGAIRALPSAADWLESAIRKWKVLFSQNHKWARIQNPRGS